uniref:Uncharacterized protein n=1 Tax=Utricularia reniformis TaxID=192314 RepID=A0A1Y0B2S2_9LAMI|nr:hypothetical protein AEK19_MT1549 [Utricularia reniformis]ART31736.1 hypothetical protein AEK19_MT1549 [Utricularia reniformis]
MNKPEADWTILSSYKVLKVELLRPWTVLLWCKFLLHGEGALDTTETYMRHTYAIPS